MRTNKHLQLNRWKKKVFIRLLIDHLSCGIRAMSFFPFVIYRNKLLKQNYQLMHYLVNNFVLLQKLGMEVS